MTSGRRGDGVRPVDGLERGHAHRAAGAVHQLDLGRQHPIDAVADDGVGLAAADLHQHPGAGDGLADRGGRGRRPARDRGTRRGTSRRRLRVGLVASSVELAQLGQHLPGACGLLPIDAGDGHAHVDQHEVAGRRRRAGRPGRPRGSTPPKRTWAKGRPSRSLQLERSRRGSLGTWCTSLRGLRSRSRERGHGRLPQRQPAVARRHPRGQQHLEAVAPPAAPAPLG